MTIDILMPALSPTMEEGTIARWVKKEGDTISSGDVLVEIETDKATVEFESIEEGVLGKILQPDGSENVPINTPIAVLLEDGESADSIGDSPAPAAAAPAEASEGPTASAPGDACCDKPAAPAVAQIVEPEYTGETVTQELRVALRDAMAEEMRLDEKVFVLGEEVADYQGPYKVTRDMVQEFGPDRVVDSPITEMGFTGLCVGAAQAGLRPVVDFMQWDFALQSIDHIINSAAKMHYMSGGDITTPIVFRGPNGSPYNVGAQHSQDLAPWLAHVPGLKVIAPYSAGEAKALLKAAIRDNNPVAFLETELLYGVEFDDVATDPDFVLPIGKAKVQRPGTDVTIVTYAIMVRDALQAAEELEKEGISAEVINLRTLRPLDKDTILQSVAKTNRVVTVEEGWGFAGIGAAVSAIIMEEAFDDLDAPVTRVSAIDVPMPYATELEQAIIPSKDEIIAAVKKVCYK